MTTLAITPNWKNKTAKFKGTVAAGEHVSVTIQNDDGEGGEFIGDASTLRLRVVDPASGRTLAIFPEPVPEGETPEEWDSDLSPLRCTLNLNTVQMLKAVPPAANVPLLFVLDDYENKTLYFKEQYPVEHWPRLRGEEEPTDLDNYKDIIEDFNTRLDGYDTRITAAENVANAATENASAAAAAANQAIGIANQAVAKAETAQNSAAASAETAYNSALAAAAAQEAAESAAKSINSPDATLAEEGVAADAKATGERIAAEEARAEAAEAAEESRAKAAESALAANVSSAQKAISDEAELRAAADADLEANKADKSAVEAISADVAAAQAAIVTKADQATTYTKSEVDAKVAAVQTFKKYLVNALPDIATADIKGLYLVPTGETGDDGKDLCDEYTVVESNGTRRWERIGGTAVDLSDYYSKTEVDNKLAGKYPVQPGGIPKTDLASGVQASLDKADTALQSAPVTSVNSKTGAVTLTASDVGAVPLTGGTMDGNLTIRGSKSGSVYINKHVGVVNADDNGIFISPHAIVRVCYDYIYEINIPYNDGTLAFLQNLAPDFSTSATYAVNDLCVYNGKLYRCTTAVTIAEAWTAAHWTEATVQDVLAAIWTALGEIPSWAKTTNKPSYTLNEVCPDVENWLGVPGTTAAGKSIKVLAKTVNGVIDGGVTVTGSSNNDNNTTKYRYGGVTVTRNGVATDYLWDTTSESGIVRRSELNDKAPLASPAFTGTPTAPDIGENAPDGQVVNKKYVDEHGGGQTDIGLSVVNGKLCVTFETT